MNKAEKIPDQQHIETDSKSDYRDVVGTALFELLWFSIDIYFVYPESHIAALWLGAAGIAIAFYRHIPSLRLALVLIISALITAWIVQFNLPPMPLQETDTHGWLIPANDPTPPNACGNPPEDGFLVLAGTMAGYVGAPRAVEEPFPVLHSGRCGDILAFQRNEKGVLIQANIFNSDGNLAARIDGQNEFHLVEHEIAYLVRDAATDPSTLKVIGLKGEELLWVRYANPQVVEIRGSFACAASQSLITVNTDGVHYTSPNIHNFTYGEACTGTSISTAKTLFDFLN